MDDERDAIPERVLDEWEEQAREGLADGATRDLGTVARDRKIRRLIEEVRRGRARRGAVDYERETGQN